MKSILILGQGIAGSLLALELEQAGVNFRIADQPAENTSSRVAAGIVNPVTGRRYVKSWRFDEFYPQARQCYQNLETMLGLRFWYDMPLLRLLSTPEEVNDWSARMQAPGYEDLLSIDVTNGSWEGLIPAVKTMGLIRQAARVDLPALLDALRSHWKKTNRWIEETPSVATIEKYLKDFDALVFCRGYTDATNAYFPNLSWNLAKGEVLILHIPAYAASPDRAEMLKKGIILAPMTNGLIWAGSNYEWGFSDDKPSADGKAFLEENLRSMLRCPYEIVAHKAAIRPTVKDRRPFLLQSPVNPRAFLCNGLGTKGTLQAPFFAREMARMITAPT